MSITESAKGLLNDGTSLIQSNTGILTAGAVGLIGGGVLGVGSVMAVRSIRKRKKRKSKKKARTRRASSSRRRKRTCRRTTPKTAGKGKDRSNRRIRYTKKGQPYIIMASGKARFIKKKGACASHKRKGGRY